MDLNRAEDNPEVIPTRAFGLAVPGNEDLPALRREERLAAVHRPYRRRVEADVRQAIAAAGPCLHLSIHSFTPALDGVARAVELGVLFDPARPLEVAAAELLLPFLRARGWDARPNEPYLGTADGLTTFLRTRLDPGDYAGVEVEVSQALLPDPAARARVTADLLEAVGLVVG